MATQQTSAPDTLPADYFSNTSASTTLPANFFSQDAAPPTLPASFFSNQAAQPAHDPSARFALHGPASIGPAPEPSIWQRIKSAVTEGIPNYSSRTVYNPRYGETQLITPEAALTPEEQRAHPIVTGAGELAGNLTSPQSVALIAGTGGLGELPGAAALLPRLMSAGFGAQSIYAAYKTVPSIRDAWNRGDVSEVERLLTHTVGNLGLAALATQHAATGEGAVSSKKAATDVPIARTSPVGELLQESAPNVRVTDSSAAANEALERDTIVPPTEARVTAPEDLAALRRPSARVVKDSHTPVVSQDEVLAQAVQNIVSNSGELRKIGVDPSQIQTREDIEAALQIASDHIKSNLDPRAETVVTLEGQKQLARDLNLTVEDLLTRRQGQTFNAEELLAARALLKANSDAVIARAKDAATSGDADSLTAFTESLARHKAIEETVAGVRAESGRALGSFRIKETQLPQAKITDALSKLPQKNQAEAARLVSRLDPTDPASVRQVNQFVEQVTPRTTLEKLNEYYRNALLSSPHTLIVKTASELSMAAMETMKKAVAGGVASFKDSPDRFASESYWYAKGMAQALADHAKPILSGEFQLEGSPGFERAGSQAIKGTLGTIVRAPSEAMSRMTNLAYAGNFFGELNSLAARQALSEGLEGDEFNARQEYLAHHPTKEMSESAHNLATRNTFQSRLGSFGEKIGQAIATKPTAEWLPESLKSVAPLKFLLPFYRTPVNLFKATITHATPYELLNGFAKGDTDAMARGIVGSSIAASLAALALSGHITGGGPTDFRKEETLRATGWQPYSVKIGDRYYSYHRFEPVGLAAGMIADTVHGMQHGDSEVVSQSKADTAAKHIARNLDDMPFMGTLANLLQAVHDPVGGRAQSFINREAGSLVPAGVANVAETLDPTVRRPQSAPQAIQSRIPGMTQAAPAVIDVTGRQVQRPLNNFGGANPFPFTTAKNDPVVGELARLGISTPQPPAQIKWRGKVTPLTDSERQQIAQDEGQEMYKRVSKLIQSGAWQKRSDDQKRKALVELHRMLDESRPSRLSKMRRQNQNELARSSLQ
jgi:hypothetical protein